MHRLDFKGDLKQRDTFDFRASCVFRNEVVYKRYGRKNTCVEWHTANVKPQILILLLM